MYISKETRQKDFELLNDAAEQMEQDHLRLFVKNSPEELAAAKAKAAENKRQKEAEDARKAGDKAQKARERAELEAKEKAEKEQRKTQLKQLRAERLADDKARLKARKG